MQFQVQTLISKDELTQKNMDDLDLFVGLLSPLNSPYNIFLRIKDIENNNDLIYFYAYSMGKQRAIIWGIYDRSVNEFLIDNSCKYHPNDLKIIIDTWKNNKYDFFFTAMRDRRSKRMSQYSIYGNNRKNMVKLIEDFKKLYLIKLTMNGLLSNKNIMTDNFDENKYNEVLEQVYDAGFKASKEEKFEPSLELLYNEIENTEDENAIRAIIKFGNWNNMTNYQMNVAKHILVHLFIMTFLTIDEYRVAKYIDYIQNNNKKDKTKLMKSIKGKFMYEWLLELGKAFRVYNLEKFMKDLSKDILRLTEKTINMTNIGVIGGSPVASNLVPLLDDISVMFEDFVSKSIYSKISYVNNLKPCPSIDICVNNSEGCELYTHGHTTFSKHDMT